MKMRSDRAKLPIAANELIYGGAGMTEENIFGEQIGVVKTNLSEGNFAFRNGDYRLAQEYYSRARQERPEMAETIDFNLALCNVRLVVAGASYPEAAAIEEVVLDEYQIEKNHRWIEQNIQIIHDSGLFDEAFYVAEYPDLAGCDSLVEHYLLYGSFEGRAASEKFDSRRYFSKHPEVFDMKMNPLIHFHTIGRFKNIQAYAFSRVAPIQPGPSIPEDELELLRNTPLFDTDHYLEKYPEVADTIFSPEEHFLLVGGVEGREASKYFNCAAYLDAYLDVKNSNMNPLIHYLMFGQHENRVAFEAELGMSSFLTATKSKKTILLDNLPSPQKPNYKLHRCALLVHAFYIDVFKEIFELAKDLPFSKIIVTTPAENFDEIDAFLRENCNYGYLLTIIQENKGRDIAPFLNDNVEELFEYDFICKVHTKKSPHLDTFGNKWKRHLVDNLIGSRSIFDKIAALFIENKDLGIAYPEPMFGTNNNDWATNKDIAIDIFEKLNINIDHTELETLDYPPATMFWFRPESIKNLFNSYSYAEFPEEPIHFDGTIAHAIERTFNYVCRGNGYSAIEYVSLATLVEKDFKESVIFDWLEQSQDREKFIVVSHEATNTGAPKTALSLLNALTVRNKSCLTILLNGGVQEPLFDEFGPVINYNGQPLRESLLKILLENKDIKVICNTVVSYRAARFFQKINLPVISLVHEFISSGHFSNEMFTTLIENSDQVIYPADFVLQDTLTNISVDATKIEIMPQGIYDDAFPVGNAMQSRKELLAELGLPKNAFIVLACGTVESRKGVDLLVQTAKDIFSKIKAKNLHFVWIGKATENDSFFLSCLDELSTSSLLKSNFHFLGAHSRVDRFFMAADLFALPSRYDPFPGVVLEAMAANLPIVCYDRTTGVHEAFEDTIGGYVCKHLDHVDMASKIIYLYKNINLAKIMGKRNQTKVRERYNFARYTDRILEKFLAMDLAPASKNKFSFVVPVYNTPPNYLQKMIQSVLNQTYANFELCIADGSTNDLAKNIINYYTALDPRIKYTSIRENKGIANNTNAAIDLTTGNYICLLDHDDVLSKRALDEIQSCIIESAPDIIYTDEDKLDENGLKCFAPVQKPAFDIGLLHQYNYITHLLTIKKSFYKKHIGKLNGEYDGAQDYDLVLRCSENTKKIHHIPQILYHWRVFENSTSKGTSASKNYAVDAGKRALEAHLNRMGRSAIVSLDKKEFRYVISDS